MLFSDAGTCTLHACMQRPISIQGHPQAKPMCNKLQLAQILCIMLSCRFIWSLISAVGIFFLGAGASFIHGVHTLAESHTLELKEVFWSYAGITGRPLQSMNSVYSSPELAAFGPS